MAENNTGCGALISATFFGGILFFVSRLASDNVLKSILLNRGMSYPSNTGVWISFAVGFITFILVLVACLPKPAPPPAPVKPPELPVYPSVCADCKRHVDSEARVCPFCQAIFTGEVVQNHGRQWQEKHARPR